MAVDDVTVGNRYECNLKQTNIHVAAEAAAATTTRFGPTLHDKFETAKTAILLLNITQHVVL